MRRIVTLHRPHRGVRAGAIVGDGPGQYGGHHVGRVLQELVEVQGAPLVIKCDNGSRLSGAEVRALMQLHRIEPLRSPVRRPSYNGAWEAMVGEVKRVAADLALQHGGTAGGWLRADGCGSLAVSGRRSA